MPETNTTPVWKKILPHAAVILSFIALALIYCYPVLQGEVIFQSDVVQAYGMQGEIRQYMKETGDVPLWTNSMFSGMPAYQIYNEYTGILVTYINSLLQLGLPNPADILFMTLLLSYLSFVLLRFNYWQAALGAIAYTFMTSNLIYLEAGHLGKAQAIAYLPIIIASVLYTLRGGKMWLGAALFALAFSLQLRVNHVQIAYYTGMLSAFIWLAYLVKSFKDQQLPRYFKATGMLVLGVVLAVAVNTSLLWVTYQYSKDTIRGGTELKENSESLNPEYAYRWSYGISESGNLLIPYFTGGGSSVDIGTKSETYQGLVAKGVPAKQAEQFVSSAPLYFGEQPFTSGPFYFGAVLCFLFVLGMLLLKEPVKWSALVAIIVSILLSWGKNFMPLTDILFNYLPLYNKFRDVKMIYIIGQTGLVLVALYTVKRIVEGAYPKEELKKKVMISAGIIGGLTLVLGFVVGGMFSFEGAVDAQLGQQWIVELLKEDRARLLRLDTLRTLFFILVGAGIIYAYAINKLKGQFVVIALAVFVLIDFWSVDKRFFDADAFITQAEYDRNIAPDAIDLAIQQDSDPHYRVLNLVANTFNDAMTSYHHKSVGGYHAAKLSRYQDLIENQISRNNRAVLNMLNTKYFIVKDQQTGGKNYMKNPEALGNAWFVENIETVDGARQEMDALNDFAPATTVVVDNKYTDYISGLSLTKAGSDIKLTSYYPTKMVYEANVASGTQLAVFSEVYYNSGKGWQAYIDGQPVEHIRVNYVLRGLKIPAGKHQIEFRFEPAPYYTGNTISIVASILLFAFVGGAAFKAYKDESAA